ncbi:phytanoyl-CoA dioxygenase family protein [Salinisphaera sp.]|uniref:phytanoyl-CoA dioxygenase family protein n=1 Tax=Salinisphaera sp. TaxID=1914330 RepID=UPI002D77B7DE|nr:phytanoyl-CoA dioxygenase family protein [Salinisphaera sp.]HET7315779.1 phytanoyl-CoA dioxygenase family protein [Salinisphaera sp.]
MTTPSETALQPHLTPAQNDAFARDGYLVMRQLASAERIAAMRSLALDHLERAVEPLEYEADVAYPGAPASRTAEGGDTVRRLLDAYDRDPGFADWAADDRLTAIVAQMLNSPTVWMTPNHHNCVMTKAPTYSSATAWHRDLRYWSFASPYLVNAWLALGDETPGNGCMRMLPGSHRMEIGAGRLDDAQFLREDEPVNAELIATAEYAELAPGDVLFFDAGVFHAAGANTGAERKLAVVTSYFGRDNAPVAGTRSARRPAIQVRE